MKIGILTCPLASNVGGILQNYALQHVLKHLGHHPITINYGARYPICRWLIGRIRSLLSGHFVYVPFPWNNRIGSLNYQKFIKKHINRTIFFKDITEKVISKYEFDAIIVGSDQVWRKDYNRNLYSMFFDFAESYDIIKISYAASFGVTKWDYTENETERCRNLISNFNAISVRESSNVVLCKTYLGVTATEVLDPTLLLEKDIYIQLCSKIPIRKNILFAYILDPDEEKTSIIYEIAKKKNLSVYIKSSEINLKEKDSIEEWISFYRDASFVVTDSYHGTLFSIVFNKDFITIPNSRRGLSRFSSILGLFCLNERLYNGNININTINWEKVNLILEKEKKKSISFLKKYLNN